MSLQLDEEFPLPQISRWESLRGGLLVSVVEVRPRIGQVHTTTNVEEVRQPIQEHVDDNATNEGLRPLKKHKLSTFNPTPSP